MIYSASLTQSLIWTSIALCVTQSAVFSGLNLAIFSVSKLRLEVEAASGNLDAIRVLDLRKDSNFTLSTIVWGNVVTNVLLTLLSDSVLAGLGAFVFSTFAHHRLWRYRSAGLFFAQRLANGSEAEASARRL